MESERRKTLENPIDYMGLGLIAVGIGCLQYVLDKGQEEDWFSSRKIIVFLAASLVALTWFVINEWRHANPIVDLQLLRLKNFRMAAIMMFILGMVMFGTTVLIPQFLQVLMGYTRGECRQGTIAGGGGARLHDAVHRATGVAHRSALHDRFRLYRCRLLRSIT